MIILENELENIKAKKLPSISASELFHNLAQTNAESIHPDDISIFMQTLGSDIT